SILQFPFVWYGKLFLRVSHAVSRRQELAADRLAAHVVGARPLAEGLRKIHVAAPVFGYYWSNEVARCSTSASCRRWPPASSGS
ncbi:MAG TPA: hypothetical protein VK547_06445, partial [Candidatus Udaeobacter sp.]|nr:hypothetical protein [Candidatus Udaeobacter sp.]